MPLREQRHARRSRRVLRWLPEALVLVLVAATFAIQGFDLSDRLFGGRHTPAEVLPPAGLDLPAQAAGEPVAGAYPPVEVDAAAVRTALAPLVKDPKLGKHLVIVVRDLGAGGGVVYQRGAGAFTPASTLKLLTSAAALESLGPETRFHTDVRLAGGDLFLVGGGDPLLMSSPAAATGQYPARADLGTLADRTAAALRSQGVSRVRLRYDTSLFTGPRVSPHWRAGYVPSEAVPISSLWADEGKLTTGGHAPDPSATAGAIFGKALSARGIQVLGPVAPAAAPPTATEVATIASAPVAEIVEHTLAVSDNNAAEVLARQVALKRAEQPSFAGGTRAVAAVLTGLGIPMAGTRLLDGSGLSRGNRLTGAALVGVLTLAASADGATLRPLITGIPVAGFTGSLQNRFEQGPVDALGRVRAKTGTLSGVHALAGVATGTDGSRMAFVAVADRVGDLNGIIARTDIDRIAAALGACRCGHAAEPTDVGSTP